MAGGAWALGPGQLAALLGALAAALLWRAGAFAPARVAAGRMPAARVALRHRRGPYRLSGGAFGEARKLVPPGTRLVGLFYDDPGRAGAPEAELRYSVGAVLEGEGVETDPKEWAAMGYEVVSLPAARAATCTFPFRGTLSILLATARVYPALTDFMAQAEASAAGAILEFYDGRRAHVDYFVPLEGAYMLHKDGDGPGGAGPPPPPRRTSGEKKFQ